MYISSNHLDLGYGFEYEKVSLVHSISDKNTLAFINTSVKLKYLTFGGVGGEQ